MTTPSSIPSDPLSQASEFCSQTCSEDLLDYLGLSSTCTSEEAQAAIHRRIETLEQQPGKQEYAHELNNLIDGLEGFLNLLSNPAGYSNAAIDGIVDAESAILNESLDLVFRKGLPTELEEVALRKAASEYGVSENDFDVFFKVKLKKHRSTQPIMTAPSVDIKLNPFSILGIEPTTSEPLVFEAYRTQHDAASAENDTTSMEKLDTAWEYFSSHDDKAGLVSTLNENLPQHVADGDLDEDTSDVPTEKKTKHPPNKISVYAKRPVNVAVHETSRSNTTKVLISGAHEVRLLPSQPWVTIHPTTLKPSPKAQVLTITVDPQGLLDDNHNATINLFGDGGSTGQIRVIAKRQNRWPINLMVVAVLLVTLVISFPHLVRLGLTIRPSSPTMLIVHTVPPVEQLLVNGTPYGSGQNFKIRNPAIGIARISALHHTFEPFKTTVNITKGQRTTLEFVMNVKEPLDFSPTKHLHRVPVDLNGAKIALGPMLPAIDNCGSLADPSASMAPPTITLHTSSTGEPIGLYISSNANHRVLYECVERIVSTVEFPPFPVGDYATIEYELSPVLAQLN
jgi:hypothetical protein